MSTLGLNMIVGPGEAKTLQRCMKSLCDGKVFDEIVIVNTSGDMEVDRAAREYTDKVLYYPWETPDYPHGNFAGARNAALDATTTDYVWWQDADDIFWPEGNSTALEGIKTVVCAEKHADVDVHFIDYAIIIDTACRPVVSFQKDRIFKREAARWKRPAHEQLFRDFSNVNKSFLSGVYSIHLPEKRQETSAMRNVAILRHEIESGRGDNVTRFFLARDLMMTQEVNEGVALMGQLFEEFCLDFNNMLAIALELCYYFGYGQMKVHPSLDELQVNVDTEQWLRLAMSLTQEFAEPYLMMGDLYQRKGDDRTAEIMYTAALKKKPNGSHQGLQLKPFYRELPAQRLAELYERTDECDKALWFNRVALEATVDGKQLNADRRRLLQKLLREMDLEETHG